MKRIIIIKTCAEVQIAHLYEHIYCEAIRALFKANNLLYYLDYTYQGTTYDKGLCHIAVDLYTSRAIGFSEKLMGLNALFDDTTLELMVAQIVAEEKHYLRSNKKGFLINGLTDLHAQPWELLDNFVSFDAQQSHRTQKKLWLSEEKAKIKTLHCDLSLDSAYAYEHRELIPLFDIVGSIIQENLARELCGKYGYYRNNNPIHYTKKSFKNSQELTGWTRYIPNLTDEISTSKSIIVGLLQSGFVRRSAAFFSKAHYREAYEAPDELQLFEATGILVGAAGWKQIGTEQNIRMVLKRATLQLAYGKEKHSFTFEPLLEDRK